MEVILREDVPGLGIIGEVVKVRAGYARNYLLPRGLAVIADRRNLGRLRHEQRIIEAKKARERGAHESLAERLNAVLLETEARAGKAGKLFGSVTNLEVHRLLAEKGYELDRRRIELKGPIKEIGEFEVAVRVGQDVKATVKLVVRPLGGQLEGEAEGEGEGAQAPAGEREAAQAQAGEREAAQAQAPAEEGGGTTTEAVASGDEKSAEESDSTDR